MAQVIKIINRFKFIDVKFGESLEKFIRSTDADFKLDAFQRDTSYLLCNGKTRGKLNNSQVSVFYFSSTNVFQPLVFIFMWLLRFFFRKIAIPKLKKKYADQFILKNSKIGKRLFLILELIYWTEKIEFIVFYIVLADAMLMLTGTFSAFGT